MTTKKLVCMVFIIFSTVNLIFVSPIFASGFTIDFIGNSSTGGRAISRWWYTSANPKLSGAAVAGSTVNITIDENSSSTTADESGSWSYTPSTLENGDHNIMLENNGSEIKFTLAIGSENIDWNAVGSSGSTDSSLPAAGVPLPAAIMLITGGIMFFVGKGILNRA